MKYILFLALMVLALAACTPQTSIENNVIPQLISAKINDNISVTLQGRYFGDGQAGASEASYVIMSGDVNCENGLMVRASSWSPSKVEVGIPAGAGYGFTCVVVDGVKSNALPVNLP